MSRLASLARRRPSPAMVVALIALFAALGGTATALRGKNRVKADDIAAKAVKKRNLRPGAVDPFKTNVVKARNVPAEATSTSGPPQDLRGPTVTVKVPSGALIAVHAEVEMRVAGGGRNAAAQVHLFEPGLLPGQPRILETGSRAFQLRKTAPAAPAGTVGEVRGGWIVIDAPPGRYTFSLRYSRAGGGTAIFRGRTLWVTVLG